MTMAVARIGRFPSYSIVTCDLPSGRRKSSSFDLRISASRRTSLCASVIGSGISSGVSRHANPNIRPWSPAPPVSTPCAISGDWGSIDEITAQVSLSNPYFARVSDFFDGVADDGGEVDVGLGGDLTRDHRHAGRHERLARDAADGILGQH